MVRGREEVRRERAAIDCLSGWIKLLIHDIEMLYTYRTLKSFRSSVKMIQQCLH